MTKEKSRPYPFLEEKKRKLIEVDKAVYDKVSNWKVKEFIIKHCKIIDKEVKKEDVAKHES